MRIDRTRLNAISFPDIARVQTRFYDVDVQGHVNNTASVIILQEARASFNVMTRMQEYLNPIRVLVASLTVEFAAELYHGAPIEVGTGVLSVGRTSVRLGQVARQDGIPSLYAETVMVFTNIHGPTLIPTGLRETYCNMLADSIA
jgi:acyl-CoA thioester hydrolase